MLKDGKDLWFYEIKCSDVIIGLSLQLASSYLQLETPYDHEQPHDYLKREGRLVAMYVPLHVSKGIVEWYLTLEG